MASTQNAGDGIEENVVVVAGEVPHGEPEQSVFDDEIALGSERLRVVVGNKCFLAFVVKEGLRKQGKGEKPIVVDLKRDNAHGLATLVILILEFAGVGPIAIEVSLFGHATNAYDVLHICWPLGERREGG